MNPQEDVLLLDVDGVLVTPPEFFGARLLREHPEAARAFFLGPFLEASTGRADLLTHLPAFLRSLGRSQSPQAFLREWLESERHPNLPLIAAVEALRAAGWRVHLATNQEAHRTQHLLNEVGLGRLVNGHFASYAVGHRKPAPEYFAEVARRLGVPSARIVFWDDSAENVAAAQAAGWRAFVYADVAGFCRVMGLPVPDSTLTSR
ncbi:HAD-IA family hydrolase [Deinococcus sp. YIM 77859]|uniref:HAD-IA family hydrolase n=1 Tax=Deinococcus sp. YIM 77859 TaxID=1540221 RepID=UPI00068F9AF2|nr:HAD-IA family hydrolase [Deinococcus sp. YIM 77859]